VKLHPISVLLLLLSGSYVAGISQKYVSWWLFKFTYP